jgi:enoyl-CoA hydratase/carnithine racemase
MIIGFVEQFHQGNDIKEILEIWWVENKRFFAKSDGLYRMTNLRDPYIYAVDLMCILYGESICIHFKYAWVSVEHVVTTTSEIFN